jgi:hypothetical protein
MNQIKTLMLLATLTALLVWGGQVIGGKNGIVLALVMAGIMNVAAYWFSDRIVLRMHNAKPISENEASGLYSVVRELAVRTNIPMPKAYVIAEEAPNAFATGRNPENATVAVTEGLLRILNREELAGVKITVKELNQSFYSDLNGQFSFSLKNDKEYSLIIEGIGFEPKSVKSSEIKLFEDISLKDL